MHTVAQMTPREATHFSGVHVCTRSGPPVRARPRFPGDLPSRAKAKELQQLSTLESAKDLTIQPVPISAIDTMGPAWVRFRVW